MKRKARNVKIIYNGPVNKVNDLDVYKCSFAKLTHAERLMQCWSLVEQAWLLKGRSLDELRFNRTVAVLKKI